MMLAELRAPFPFGVLLVTDDKSTEYIPDWASDDEQVTSSGSAMVIKIRHEVDGPAVVRVWDEDAPRAGAVLAEKVLSIKSGDLRVSTATGERQVRISVPAGNVRIKVVGSDRRYSDEVDLVVTPEHTDRWRSQIQTLEPRPG